ncbi:hypothetical protein N431DRAFT_228375 [Stipitochalara longipes BDJ]|nr:hypothetical protein N431DRAFT_228375 [Stipitochalara longipes BDJ]
MRISSLNHGTSIRTRLGDPGKSRAAAFFHRADRTVRCRPLPSPVLDRVREQGPLEQRLKTATRRLKQLADDHLLLLCKNLRSLSVETAHRASRIAVALRIRILLLFEELRAHTRRRSPSTGECFSPRRRGRSEDAAKSRCWCYPYYAEVEFYGLWFVRWSSRVCLTKPLPAGAHPGEQPDTSTRTPPGPGGQPMAARRGAYAGTESRIDAPFRRRKLEEPL